MIRNALTFAGVAFVSLALIVGVLYQFFGLRFIMDGGGTPRPRFVETSQLQAERIQRHRDAQRATSDATAVDTSAAVAVEAPVESPAVGSIPSEAAHTSKAEPVASGPAPYWTD